MDQNGLGAWMDVLEYIGYATVIMNCVFLYWFRLDFIRQAGDFLGYFKFLFPQQLQANENGLLGPREFDDYEGVTDHDIVNFMILIILTEHCVVLTKFVLQTVIGDVPNWVSRQLIKVNTQMEKMSLKQKEDEANKKFKSLHKQIMR